MTCLENNDLLKSLVHTTLPALSNWTA